ncbi:hypothetical protein E1211_00730 [Micromonospora sp. 15K316]|uniref:hypothetical protein n=1 Tax=Micromonospora sp. 15K316 TaxID=2530376 RepID=UPI001044C485|nr:hypothetical protein [Micromonospora sp. 15K316]TDC40666.1 hypothetical protein E1211_00730 [Micromonospora sp. 15K316]
MIELGTPRVTDLAAAPARRRTLHILLSLQSLSIVLVSVNRLSDLTLGFVAPNEFLRWSISTTWSSAWSPCSSRT